MSLRYAPAFTLGVANAVNMGSSPVVLDKVALPHATHFRLLKSFIIDPAGVWASFGLWNGFPPRLGKDRRSRGLWATREPLAGAVVRPGEIVSLVLGATGQDDAASGPIQVDYHDRSGATGSFVSNVTYRLRETC